MFAIIVLLERPLVHMLGKFRQRPYAEPFWVCRLRHFARLPRRLCIAQEVVNKLCVHRAKEPLFYRTETRLRCGSLMLPDFEEGEEFLEVHALKLLSPINDNRRRESFVAFDA